MFATAHSLLRWLLGPLPEVEEAPDGAQVFVATVLIAVVAMWLDTKHTFRAPAAEHAWTLAIYGALPLLAAVAWDVRSKTGPRTVMSIILTLWSIMLISRVLFVDTIGVALRDNPEWLVAGSAAAILAAVATASRSGTDLESWGIGLGDWRWWGPRFLLVGALMEVMVLTAALAFPEIRDFYPEDPAARTSLWALAGYQAWLGVYMLGWEMFFRGTLVHGLARRGDVLVAILVPAIPFFLLHWHKPEVEMLASFVGSVGAGWFALRARSFVPIWLMHWAMNLSMELTAFGLRWFGGTGATG